MRKIMHILTLLLGAALVALGVGCDMVRRRPPRSIGRHRRGTAPGTGAQWLTTHPAAAAAGGADTQSLSRGQTYQSGRPLYPEGQLW